MYITILQKMRINKLLFNQNNIFLLPISEVRKNILILIIYVLFVVRDDAFQRQRNLTALCVCLGIFFFFLINIKS